MRFYQLNPHEFSLIHSLNMSRQNVLLIICDHGDGYIGVDADDLESLIFEPYFDALVSIIDSERVSTMEIQGDEAIFS